MAQTQSGQDGAAETDASPAANHLAANRQTDGPDSPAELGGSSWMGVLKRALKGFKTDNLSDWAAALTYRGVMCMAPGLLVVVAVLGLLGKSTTDTLVANIGQLAPGGVKSVLQQVITNVQGKGSAGVAGLIGIALALNSASGYISAFMRASNAIYGVGEGRPVWKTLPIRLAVTVAIVILILVSAVLVVFTGPIAQKTGSAIGLGSTAVTVFDIVKWPVLIVIVSLMLSILYFACPNVRQPGFRWVSPGGVLAVVIWLVASALFALYVADFGSYNKTYGSLAAVIVFLVWLWISNVAILLGAEFNAEMQRAKAIEDGPTEDADTFPELRDDRKLDDAAAEQATALSSKQTT